MVTAPTAENGFALSGAQHSDGKVSGRAAPIGWEERRRSGGDGTPQTEIGQCRI